MADDSKGGFESVVCPTDGPEQHKKGDKGGGKGKDKNGGNCKQGQHACQRCGHNGAT